jgi:hypothetical protein
LSEKQNSFLRSLKNKDFKGGRTIKVGLYALIQASDDFTSFLSYPLVRFLMRGGEKRCGGFG